MKFQEWPEKIMDEETKSQLNFSKDYRDTEWSTREFPHSGRESKSKL